MIYTAASPIIDSTKISSNSQTELHHIRITLTSHDLKAVEKVSLNLIHNAKTKQIKTKGPVRLPIKALCITTRKSPCGNGTATYDKFEMRIYRRLVDLIAPSSFLKQTNSILTEPGVEVKVTIFDRARHAESHSSPSPLPKCSTNNLN